MAYSKTTWKNRVVQNPQTYLQQQNADGTVTLIPKEGTITEPGTPVNAVNMNNIENGISTLDAQNSIYNAGGTANAITVATTNGDYSYAQFKRLSIRAATDNTGDVTINVDGKGAVPALKYDKSQIPAGGIKAGKVYDFYYDTVNACFFLIAKASGNAVAADVLAGKTFSNDTDSGLVGTLEEKQDILADYFLNAPMGDEISVGFIPNEGLWMRNINYNSPTSVYLYNSSGNIVKTLAISFAYHVSKNYILAVNNKTCSLFNKQGVKIRDITVNTNYTIINAAMNEETQKIYIVLSNGCNIYDFNGTLLKQITFSETLYVDPTNYYYSQGSIVVLSNGIVFNHVYNASNYYGFYYYVVSDNGSFKKMNRGPVATNMYYSYTFNFLTNVCKL